jgi:hypothetical protein
VGDERMGAGWRRRVHSRPSLPDGRACHQPSGARGVRPGHRSDADWPRSTRRCGVASRCRATRDGRP